MPARSHHRPGVPTVLLCPGLPGRGLPRRGLPRRGRAAPPSRPRCWPPCTWSSRRCASAGAPTSTSWLTLAFGLVVVPLTTGLSVLVARRREGAVVGVLLGLLSLAVAHVVAKEVWLQWLAAGGHPEDWAWLVAVTAEDAWWVLATFGLLLLYFPDGRLPSRRWRWVPPTLVGSVVLVPGVRRVRADAVPPARGGPRATVRPRAAVAGGRQPRVLRDAPAAGGLRRLARAALPRRRRRPSASR